MKRRKLFCLLLAAVMLFSLAACGKGEDETKDPNLLTVGEFELHYTDYFWAIYETVMQNDTELETAVVYLNEETLEAVDDSQYQNVAPGATFEVQTAYELIDTAGEVEVTFEEMEGDKNDSITIDLSSVSRESASGGTAQLTGGNKGEGTGGGGGVPGGETGASGGEQLQTGTVGGS